jgi:hypothetical protein
MEVVALRGKSQILNPKHQTNSKSQCPNVPNDQSFGHLDLENLNLPFDFAQGGELVEPFRI